MLFNFQRLGLGGSGLGGRGMCVEDFEKPFHDKACTEGLELLRGVYEEGSESPK